MAKVRGHPFCRCLFYSASALARETTRLAEEAFAPSGLAPSVAYVLKSVLREPGVGPGRNPEIMMLDASTVTRLLDRLERRKLARRRARGRRVAAWPPAEAKALGATLERCAEELNRRLGKALGKDIQPLTAGVFDAALAVEARGGRS